MYLDPDTRTSPHLILLVLSCARMNGEVKAWLCSSLLLDVVSKGGRGEAQGEVQAEQLVALGQVHSAGEVVQQV